MKNIIILIGICLMVSCKPETKENNSTTAKNETKQEVATTQKQSADYSSLFNNYSCDVSIAVLAKILKIPVSDIRVLESNSLNECFFKIKGFGEGHDNTGTTLRFMPVPSSKEQIKKEIANLLKDKAELPSGVLMGRDILLADTGDCYIALQPRRGMVSILNENYNSFIVITYQTKASVQGRTEEQHDLLKLKAIDLANYLVKTHKK
ncbi:hypothetical protein H8K90_12820 [Winogradskyella echinorum]|uniref:Lipoprotein n=1 Tax=Winogradskyella echinorum TaxID=538189 RepID=A0ABR6Y3E5_9FLAO|nr:hypothetical protein [Winogradskyella echinorum]MBC3847272.1 hypothetical protein [Winogradskyella echinorum]MBC5751620.1 hypothetical protein [Winogradskyella echinorum]